MIVRDTRGTQFDLGDTIGKGGQATVHQIPRHKDRLAKIFHKPDTQTENKIAWMIGNPPEDPSAKIGHSSIAWPLRLLYADRQFCGYLMPYVRGAVAMLNVFNPKLRKQTFQSFNEHYQHNTARNLATALGALHARGYIVGDLNESNIMVTPTTLVTMIDTDSFQVRAATAAGKTILYPCPVGKIEYLPPELQGAALRGVERKPEHDRFALGVLIFQLLMNGSHPFRARWRGSGDAPSMQERIRQGMFPYADRPPKYISPPLPLDILHPDLVALFKKCFIHGHDLPHVRPSPEEWELALDRADRELIPCGKGHYMGRHLKDCPECARLEKRAPSAMPAPPPQRRIAPLPTIPASQPAPSPKPPAPSTPGGRGSSPGAVTPAVPAPPEPARKTILPYWGYWVLGLGGVGLALGLLMGVYLPGVPAGNLLGIISGLACGGLSSEVIQRRKYGWEIVGGGTGALAGWLLFGGTAWGSAAAFMGGMTGLLLGRGLRQAQSPLPGALAGAGLGWFLGGAFAGLGASPALAGAISGFTLGVLAGLVTAVWERFG
jgi:serine/threonine protein kinase